MLALEVEFLLSRVFAAKNEEDPAVDWPPQPDRMFSALVAAWAARGKSGTERDALEWLEQQPAPRIFADEPAHVLAPTVFVPPNDFKTSKSGFDVIPARRRRQERRFPNGYLADPVMWFVWDADPSAETHQQLDAIARDTAYVGHSASLTRCRFLVRAPDLAGAMPSRRTIYQGRLQELELAYSRDERPNLGYVLPALERATPAVVPRVFSDQWVVLADDGGRAPDLRAAPLIARALRDAMMAKLGRKGLEIPEWLSGHDEGGAPTKLPHLAILPLADVGWEFSEGRLMGCALVLPRVIAPEELDRVVAELVEDRGNEEPTIELHYGSPAPWYLSPVERPILSSLKPGRWLGSRLRGASVPSALWTTATPIALDRYPKARDAAEGRLAEIAGTLAQACRNVGLPEPSEILISAASSLRGAPPAYPRRGAPPWQSWQLPQSLRGRYLTHATLRFPAPVRGPILLGAGRYVGLGLCLPASEKSDE
jgi:CRISPR-associated protein Csb2